MPGWHASTPKKEKREEKERVKHPNASQATDVLTGDEEQNGKQNQRRSQRLF